MSETQNLNQSLVKENENLRKSNGLSTKKEQNALEDENAKLKLLVNKSNVSAVDKAIDERNNAISEMQKLNNKYKREIRKAERTTHLAEKQMLEANNMLKRKSFLYWFLLAFILICSCIKSKQFLEDVKYLFSNTQHFAINIWNTFSKWIVKPSYHNSKDNLVYFEGNTTWIVRIIAVLFALAIMTLLSFIICKLCYYKQRWCTLSLKVFVISLTIIFVFGDNIRNLIPLNLICVFLIIQVLYLGILKYMDGYYENRQLYDRWEKIQNS
ncbi:DUF6040 family protein [Eubacterium sp. AF15-50]|uniref:DUF6040 family protein n=1 Tax=Eubacterium sp. AF15-50 TaxID=2293103 RepID=UPI0034A0C037